MGRRPSPTWVVVAVWVGGLLVAMGLVLYAVEPVVQARTQEALLDRYREQIDRAANEAGTLYGVTVPTKAPDTGDPVAILEIDALGLQQVVVEGVDPSVTRDGPGHVPGTAAPGQPGNSVVLGRRGMFGGPFRDLDRLAPGAEIVVSTTQGRALYRVEDVRERLVLPPPTDQAQPANAAATGIVTAAVAEDERSVSVDELYGPTDGDQLTLVTSAQVQPWNGDRAVVVVASLVGRPYPPTPQNGRVDSATGLTAEAGAWAGIALTGLALAACGVFAVYLFRRTTFRIAYLLAVPALLACTVLAAQQVSRLFPAWA